LPQAARPADDADAQQQFDKAVEDLKSGKPDVQVRAAQAIRTLKIAPEVVVTRLLPVVLPKEGAELNAAAVGTIAGLKGAAVPALTAVMQRETGARRRVAMFVLGQIGSPARPATDALVALLKDPDVEVRGAAIETLDAIVARSAVPQLLPLLESDDPKFQMAVMQALIHLDVPAKDIVQVLVASLKSEDAFQRLIAAKSAGEFGPEAAPTVPGLIEILDLPNAELAMYGVRSLGRIGPAAKEAAPALRKTLQSDAFSSFRLEVAEALWRVSADPAAPAALKQLLDQKVHTGTAHLLWKMEHCQEAINALRSHLASDAPVKQLPALEVLITIGPAAKETLPDLLPLLKSDDETLRFRAAECVGRFGKDGRSAEKELRALLDDAEPVVKSSAALSVWQVGGDIASLRKLLSSDDAVVRAYAADQFTSMDSTPAEIVPALKAGLGDADTAARLKMAEALWIQTKDPAALAVVLECLADPSATVRCNAARALGMNFPAKQAGVVDGLVKALRDSDDLVSIDAAEALGRLGPDAAAAVPELVAVVSDPDRDEGLHSAAIEALGLMGPAAVNAVDVVRKRVGDLNPYVRVHACLALWHIAGEKAGGDVLVESLQSRNPRVRIVAAEALGRQKDERSIATLREILKDALLSNRDSVANERFMIARALGRLGPMAAPAKQDLLELQNDRDPIMRATVADTVRRMEPASK
jgi:HEAT repeat protein